MDTEGKTLAELGATEGLKPGDVVRCEYDGGHGRLVSGRQYDVVNRNGYLAIHVGGGWYIMLNYSARFTIVSRATPADPVKLDEGGKVADWPWASVTVECVDEDGTDTEVTVRQCGAVILECDGFSLTFSPENARSLALALSRYAPLAALEVGK